MRTVRMARPSSAVTEVRGLDVLRTHQVGRRRAPGRFVPLGSGIYWLTRLPQILLDECHRGAGQASPPLRLGEEFLDSTVREATATVRDRAQPMGIEFISGMDYFCTAQGGLTRLSQAATQLLSCYGGHLPAAVAHDVEQRAPLLLEGKR